MTVEQPTLDRQAAELLSNKIIRAAQRVRLSLSELYDLVQEARDGSAHLALGYRSWPEYLVKVLGEQPLRDRDERRELVAFLTGQGMSTRAIAPVVGADHSTVVRDRQSSGASAPVDRPSNGAPSPAAPVAPAAPRPTTVMSLDGRQRPATQPPRPVAAPEPQAPARPEPTTVEEIVAVIEEHLPPGDGELSVAQMMENTEFHKNVSGHLKVLFTVTRHDAARFAELLDDDEHENLDVMVGRFTGWWSSVAAARAPKLRSIRGGR